MALIDTAVVFLVSLLIGGLGIHLGTLVITGESDYGRAVWTALFGALVWGLVGLLFGYIPLLGPALVFLSYLGVVKARSDATWIEAAGITVVAWVAALAVLWVLAETGYTTFEAVGVPGV